MKFYSLFSDLPVVPSFVLGTPATASVAERKSLTKTRLTLLPTQTRISRSQMMWTTCQKRRMAVGLHSTKHKSLRRQLLPVRSKHLEPAAVRRMAG
jgi:hypothetical protein